jgi:hypothetical protein
VITQASLLIRATKMGGAALAALLCAAPPATAQNGDQQIVVQGERLPVPIARARAETFIQSTGIASGSTPTARWVDPVCPRVLGLNEAGTRAAEARIRAVATDAGVPIAPERCDSNLVVSFANDGAALVREIDRRSPSRLAQVPLGARDALLNGSAPIRWWYTSETRGRDNEGNQRVASGAGQFASGRVGPGAAVDGGKFGTQAPPAVHYNNSIVSTLTTRVLVSAGVVIDQDRVMGMRLRALADYAALVALAEIRSQEFSGQGSVLNLFDAQGAPTGMTAQDMAFLRALYRMPLDREARRHRGHLVGEMVAAATGDMASAN